MAELKAQGELDNTLVVLTADHGSVAGKNFYGKSVAERDYGYYNWYYGDPENDARPTTGRRTPCSRWSTPATSASPTATRCCGCG